MERKQKTLLFLAAVHAAVVHNEENLNLMAPGLKYFHPLDNFSLLEMLTFRTRLVRLQSDGMFVLKA